jgi:hypothetical protein
MKMAADARRLTRIQNKMAYLVYQRVSAFICGYQDTNNV